MALCRFCQSQPRGFDTSPPRYGWVAQVDDDEWKAAGKQHLGADQGLFQMPGAGPEQSLEIDSCGRG